MIRLCRCMHSRDMPLPLLLPLLLQLLPLRPLPLQATQRHIRRRRLIHRMLRTSLGAPIPHPHPERRREEAKRPEVEEKK